LFQVRARSGPRRPGDHYPAAVDGDSEGYEAMELALRVGEHLLAGGETAETTEVAMSRLTRAYGLPRCEANVSLNAISLSYIPGGGRPPVTGERRIRRRLPNYTRLVAVHRLVRAASEGEMSLKETQEGLYAVLGRRQTYPGWLLAGALALIAAGGAVLVGGGSAAALAAFGATLLGDRTGAWLGRRDVAEFFQLALASGIGALVTVALVELEPSVRSGSIIIGVVIALIPGRSLVAGLQDGIAGDLVTGSARLLEVTLLIAAILAGVAAVIYAAARMGAPISLENLPQAPVAIRAPQVCGAVLISLGFGVYLLDPPELIPFVAVGGGLSWTVAVTMRLADLPSVPATLIATTVLGLTGAAYARVRHLPALVCVVPCIAPLMPGTLMYRGMLEITTGEAGAGGLVLAEALSTALAVGAGVIMGGEILRALTVGDLVRRARLRPSVSLSRLARRR
jgi:uncharacterized membrane protein YjjP (DUF1212 family)